MTTPSSVPAQGEAMRAVPAEQLQRWAELCEKGHGHAMAQEIRRALVAASPCAAQPTGRALPNPGSPEASAMMDSLLAEYQWPANTKNAARAGWEAANRWLTAAAAQGGQQPDEEITEAMLRAADAAFHARDGHAARVVYAGIYRAMRVAAPAAPAAPLTQADVDRLVYECRQEGDDSTYALVRKVESAHGIMRREK